MRAATCAGLVIAGVMVCSSVAAGGVVFYPGYAEAEVDYWSDSTGTGLPPDLHDEVRTIVGDPFGIQAFGHVGHFTGPDGERHDLVVNAVNFGGMGERDGTHTIDQESELSTKVIGAPYSWDPGIHMRARSSYEQHFTLTTPSKAYIQPYLDFEGDSLDWSNRLTGGVFLYGNQQNGPLFETRDLGWSVNELDLPAGDYWLETEAALTYSPVDRWWATESVARQFVGLTIVPEPASALLAAAMLGGFGFIRGKRREA